MWWKFYDSLRQRNDFLKIGEKGICSLRLRGILRRKFLLFTMRNHILLKSLLFKMLCSFIKVRFFSIKIWNLWYIYFMNFLFLSIFWENYFFPSPPPYQPLSKPQHNPNKLPWQTDPKNTHISPQSTYTAPH